MIMELWTLSPTEFISVELWTLSPTEFVSMEFWSLSSKTPESIPAELITPSIRYFSPEPYLIEVFFRLRA